VTWSLCLQLYCENSAVALSKRKQSKVFKTLCSMKEKSKFQALDKNFAKTYKVLSGQIQFAISIQ
jgi:hypothetical protein